MGGAKLLGEGSGGRLRPPVGPGQSPGRGVRVTGGAEALHLIKKNSQEKLDQNFVYSC